MSCEKQTCVSDKKKTCAWKLHALGSTATASSFVWVMPWFGPFVE